MEYMEKVEKAKKKFIDKIATTVNNFEYESTEQKIADVMFIDLSYNITNIIDFESYFEKLKNVLTTFENLTEEYNEKIEEIEKNDDEEF